MSENKEVIKNNEVMSKERRGQLGGAPTGQSGTI